MMENRMWNRADGYTGVMNYSSAALKFPTENQMRDTAGYHFGFIHLSLGSRFGPAAL